MKIYIYRKTVRSNALFYFLGKYIFFSELLSLYFNEAFVSISPENATYPQLLPPATH